MSAVVIFVVQSLDDSQQKNILKSAHFLSTIIFFLQQLDRSLVKRANVLIVIVAVAHQLIVGDYGLPLLAKDITLLRWVKSVLIGWELVNSIVLSFMLCWL